MSVFNSNTKLKLTTGLPGIILLGLFACGDDTIRTPNRRAMTPPSLNTLVISTPSTAVNTGANIALVAQATYSDGTSKDVSAEASWSSSMTAVATVDLVGNVSALGLGITTITASYESVTGTVDIQVTDEQPMPMYGLSISPNPANLEIGRTQQFIASLSDQNGTMVDVSTRVDWSLSDTNVASLDANNPGSITTIMNGQTTLTASDMETGESAQVLITVSGSTLDRIEINPAGATIPLGSSGRFTAEAIYSDNSRMDVTEMLRWSSSSTATAQVSNQAGLRGRITTSAIGITSITATDEQSQQSATVTLTVTNPAVLSVRVAPSTAMTGIGRNESFTATAIYSDGTQVDVSRRVTWSSSNPMVASVSNMSGTRGTANALMTGTATISALHMPSGVSSDDSNTSGVLTVLPAILTSIAVTPLQVTIPLGSTQAFVATGLYSSGPGRDISNEVVWQSSNTMVATVSTGTSNPGLAQSLSQGQANIIAVDPTTGISSDDSGRSAVLTVDPPTLTRIEVQPNTASLVVMGQQQFTAIAHFSDGTQTNITRLRTTTWVSTDNSVISVNSLGGATANSVGNAVISARDTRSNVNSDDSNDSASITVSNAMLVSIAITPTSTVVPVGVSSQYTATGTYNNGATADITESVTWNTSDTQVATVANTPGGRGLVSSISAGGAVISALEPSSGISSDTSGQSGNITVTNLSITALEIGPNMPMPLAVGDTQTFWATATFSDGSQFDVTNTVSWSSSQINVANFGAGMNAPGVIEAFAIGQTNVSAQTSSMVVSNTISLSVSSSYIFSDDFEDGDFSDWSGTRTGFSIDNSLGANGTSNSLKVNTNGGTQHFNGVYYQFPSAQPSELSVHVRTDREGANGYVVLGDNSSSSNYGVIFFHFATGNTMYLYANSRRYGSTSYTENTWYHLEFKNIDWSAKTLSFHVNGSLIEANIPFRANSNSVTRLSFYNFTAANTWWDEIILR